MNKYIRNKHGSALTAVILVMLVLVVMGTAILNLSLSDGRNAIYQEKSKQAFYVAKSGAQITAKKVDNILTTYEPKNMNELLTRVSNYTSTIDGQGKFDITYDASKKSENIIKIISKGARSALSNSDIVTLLMKITFPLPTSADSGGWLSGNSNILDHDPEYRHVGEIVDLIPKNGTLTIKSPQNPGSTPLYQASIIRLSAGDPSLIKANNSCTVTFDAEILYFENEIKDEDSKGDEVYLTISDEVVEDDSLSTKDTGFENYDRYKEFAEPYDGFVKGGITYELKANGHYSFVPATHYGLVYLGGGTIPDGAVTPIPGGYYFYPENLNVFASDAITKLIKIDTNDAVIAALENLFLPRAYSEDYVWGSN